MGGRSGGRKGSSGGSSSPVITQAEMSALEKDYHFVDGASIQTLEDIAKQRYKDAGLEYKLSKEETWAIAQYSTSAYSVANQRGYVKAGDEKLREKYRDQLEKSLNKLPDFKGTTYRTEVVFDYKQRLAEYKSKVGQNIKVKAFTSTSSIKDGYGMHTIDKTQSTGLRFIIRSKRGKDISRISNSQQESEILFNRNSNFKVRRVQGNIIVLDEV